MELEIFWTQFAKDKLYEIFEYYTLKAGVRVAKNLVNGIVDETLKLKISPYIGQAEKLLNDRPIIYRYLVYKNYKIIYWVDDTNKVVYVSHVFDTRQTPTKIIKF